MRLSKKQREAIRARFGGHCAYCGCVLPDKWHVDHVKPVNRVSQWDRGKRIFIPTGELGYPEHNTLDNLYPACPPCNIDKRNSTLEDWRTYLSERVRKSLMRTSAYRNALRFGLITEQYKPIVFYFETVERAE